MIFTGLGKTRLIGNSVKNTEDLLNLLHCYRMAITHRHGKDTADDLIVTCVKMLMLTDPEKRKEAEKQLAKLLMKIKTTEYSDELI